MTTDERRQAGRRPGQAWDALLPVLAACAIVALLTLAVIAALQHP